MISASLFIDTKYNQLKKEINKNEYSDQTIIFKRVIYIQRIIQIIEYLAFVVYTTFWPIRYPVFFRCNL